jgi:hypothetical protein
MNDANLLIHPPALVLNVTAAQGDGTTCTAFKSAGAAIYLSLSCNNTVPGSLGSLKTATLLSTGNTPTSSLWNLGDVMCLFLINPTATAIPAQGSWTAIPAVSVGWQCSTNIRTNGSISGQTAVVAGAVSWP